MINKYSNFANTRWAFGVLQQVLLGKSPGLLQLHMFLDQRDLLATDNGSLTYYKTSGSPLYLTNDNELMQGDG